MVMSWGGYSFVINLLPIYCLASIFTGRLSSRLYIAFAPLVIMGTLMAGVCVCVCVYIAFAPLVIMGTLMAGVCVCV